MKAHIVTSDLPLEEKRDYVGLCGAPIKGAVWIYMIDLGVNPEFMSSQSLNNTCHGCYHQAPPKHRFMYGAVNGEEYMQKLRRREEVA